MLCSEIESRAVAKQAMINRLDEQIGAFMDTGIRINETLREAYNIQPEVSACIYLTIVVVSFFGPGNYFYKLLSYLTN